MFLPVGNHCLGLMSNSIFVVIRFLKNNICTMKSFPMNEFISLSDNKQFITLNKNDWLFKEKQAVKGVFCLIEGKIKVYQKNSDNTETFLYQSSAPDIICLYSILNEEKYQNSAEAVTEVKACYIPKKEFMKIMFDNTKYTLNLMKIMCSKIKEVERRMNGIRFSLNMN
jgi:CRP-like cAMP-binding protein